MRDLSYLLLALSYLVASSQAKNLCSSLADFESKNQDFLCKLNNDAKKTEQKVRKYGGSSDEDEISFVGFTDYMIRNSKIFNVGGFGQVYELKNNNDIVIKKVVFEDKDKQKSLDEIEVLREICGQSFLEYPYISSCKSELIPSFFGCILDGNSIFQFHRKMAYDITTVDAITAYRALRPYQRIVVMLDIIDRFIELHNLKFVHSDIKPSNIMLANKDFSDIRIIDFGLARKAGVDFIAGTEGYKPPEVYLWNKKPSTLAYNIDVFALGMTFAEMEGGFNPEHNIIKGGCLLDKSKTSKCEEEIKKGLDNAFDKTKGLRSLLPEIQKAVNFSVRSRFKTMKEFADAIIEKIPKVDGTKEHLTSLFKESENEIEYEKLPSYWRKKVESTYSSSMKQKQKNASNENKRWYDCFICSCLKKKKMRI